MRKFDFPYMADWFVISLRWVILVGLTVALGIGQEFALFTSLPLAALLLWNLTMTVMAGLNMRMSLHRLFSVLMDLVLVGAFYWAQGGLRGPAYWAGLLPVISGAIYYEFWGALLSSLAFSMLVLWDGWQAGDLLLGGSVAAGQSFLSLLFGFLSRSMSGSMKENRENLKSVEEKKVSAQAAEQAERTRAMYELTLALTSSLSYAHVLESALNVSASALNPADADDPLVGAVMLFKDDTLQVGAARRFTQSDMRVTLPAQEGILKSALEEADAVLFADISTDPELSQIVAFANCQSGYCFPLRSGLDVYGALLFAHPQADYFHDERCRLLDIIGRQSVVAIQNAKLYQDLLTEKERMMEVQEEARKKLARDLHDGPTQSVAAMAMRLSIIKRMLDKDTKMAGEEITKLEELAHRTVKEIRHMLFTLRPLVLEAQGLKSALQAMADKMRETYNQNVVIQIDESIVSQLEMGKQGVIFYIVEEAVNNARKHAKAETITARLRPLEKEIALLEIVDNGVGFDIKAMSEEYLKRANSSLGMVNLRERAEMVNGVLQMDSALGKGTKVQVYLPLTEDAADRMRRARGK